MAQQHSQTVLDRRGRPVNFDAAVLLMEDDLREEIHGRGIADQQAFFDAYAEAHESRFGEPWEPAVGGAW